MKKLRYLLTIAGISLMLVLMMLPASADTLSGKCGDNATWTLDTVSGELVISGSGEMYDYEGIECIVGRDRRMLVKSVVMSDEITYIGDQTFFVCFNMTSIDLPENLTGIGKRAFNGTALKSFTLSDKFTAVTYEMFHGADKLVEIILPDTITKIEDNAFAYCSALEKINLPDSVESIGRGIFYDCKSLKTVKLPSKIANGSKAGSMFSSCESLESIVIPGDLTSIERFFTGCSSLKSVVLEEGIQTIWSTFTPLGKNDDAPIIEEITIPSTVIKMDGGSFNNCHQLKVVHFEGNAPELVENNITFYNDDGTWYSERMNAPIVNAHPDLLIYYKEGTTGWDAPAWSEYNMVMIDDPNIPDVPEVPDEPIVNPFTDVSDSDYFYEPVLWAYDKKVTTGKTATTFGPESSCTRGQVVTFLWRAAGCPEPSSNVNPFTDVPEGEYYYTAVLWAVEQGITAGTSATTFSPAKTCSSAHIITFLFRANGGKDGWYQEAKQWATDAGLIEGTGIEVDPNEDCARSAVVTFLYRQYN